MGPAGTRLNLGFPLLTEPRGIEPYRTGKAGRPARAITMEDRLRTLLIMKKIEPRMDELLANMFESALNSESEEVRRKATKDLIESCIRKLPSGYPVRRLAQ